MKIKKHVMAWGLVAGLACVGGVGAHGQSPFDSRVEVGWWLAKKAADAKDMDEDSADLTQAVGQAVGAAGGALVGAVIGAKFGSLGGPIGALAGAGIGAA